MILKPAKAFGLLKLNKSELKSFDIRKMADNLLEGQFIHSDGWMRISLRTTDYNGKLIYSNLPHCVTYYYSRETFNSITIDSYSHFYFTSEDKDVIYKEYCEEFFQSGYESVKVSKLYKRIQKERPELFI